MNQGAINARAMRRTIGARAECRTCQADRQSRTAHAGTRLTFEVAADTSKIDTIAAYAGGVMAKYAALVGSASQGAVTTGPRMTSNLGGR